MKMIRKVTKQVWHTLGVAWQDFCTVCWRFHCLGMRRTVWWLPLWSSLYLMFLPCEIQSLNLNLLLPLYPFQMMCCLMVSSSEYWKPNLFLFLLQGILKNCQMLQNHTIGKRVIVKIRKVNTFFMAYKNITPKGMKCHLNLF